MGYARSAARKQLDDRLARLIGVARVAGRLRIGGKKNAILRESMYSSVILLSFAHFESYISDICADLCKALCSGAIPASKLNSALRAHVAVASCVPAWSDIQDPTKLRQQIVAYKGSGGFDLLIDDLVPTWIEPSTVLAGISYPKPKNIKRLLERLGVDEPLLALKAVGGIAVMQKLTSIHDARAELAHTGRLPGWTPADYELRVTDLGGFASALDRVIWKYMCACIPSKHWIT